MSHIHLIKARARQLFDQEDKWESDGLFQIMLLRVALWAATLSHIDTNDMGFQVYAEMRKDPKLSVVMDEWAVPEDSGSLRFLVCSMILSEDSPFLDELKREIPGWEEKEAHRCELGRKWAEAYEDLIRGKIVDDGLKAEKRARELKVFPIEDLGFGLRVQNLLKRNGVDTNAELVGKREKELLAFDNFGKKALEEVKEVLERNGQKLKD